ncbi:HP domain-containing protein [Entamoeba marina]
MHLLFFWQGRRCAVLEKGVSARMTVEFHQTLQNETKEIRVVQSSETRHFLSIFQNRMVIHNGKHNEQQKTVLLYDVRGREEPFIKAIQCDVSADKLCSYGVFILLTSTTQFIWKGRLRNEKYVEFAREIGNVHAVMKRDNVIEIDEGNEPKEFFEAIGGFISIQQPTQMHTDRLYQCSATSGIFKSEEHVRFYQDQLYSNDVMLLDTADAIYVWIGKRSTNTERKYTYKIALEFVKKTKPVEMQKRPVYHGCAKKGDVTTLNEHLTLAEDEYKKYFVKYTYAVLTARTFPKGIDEQALETYLTDEEFEEVFQKSKEEFERLPTWKRNALKKRKEVVLTQQMYCLNLSYYKS